MADNVGTVTEIYEAFGRGDVPTILGHLSEDVEWEKGQRSTTVAVAAARPRHRPRHRLLRSGGREPRGVRAGREPMAGEHTVAVPIRFRATINRNGALVGEDLEVHVWWFDDDGQGHRVPPLRDTT